VEARLESIPGTPLRQLIIDGRTHVWPVERLASARWLFDTHGDAWEVEVLDERTRHIRQLTGAGQGQSRASVVKAPMPGLVVRVEVEVGQSVDPGQGVIVLEAMKMENELRAVGGGVVRAVLVSQGAAVEKGDVLVEFEDGPSA
jgi:pyruvate carboxylase subunit B